MQSITRLISRFQPEHYSLSLSLNRSERTFDGIVTLNGQATTDDGRITLHAKDLQISSATVDGASATFELNDDELDIRHEKLLKGAHVIVVAFSGTITDSMHGLYPCYYEHDGEKKELLATQFESHHAREVFPCIDEPEAKATFDVTLRTEQDVTVLGNMPVTSQAVENDQLVTSFETTPRMSTYLLAWVVGSLHRKSATTKSGVEVSIWATPAQPANSLDFALDIATRTIDFFDDYFGTPYPLPKADHVALPDFSSGAMENWGLITYREVALLAEPDTTALESKQQIALVVAHELSHQWFGNLVTMKWWNDLWLNESFANMMEYVAIDALEPDWQIWLDHATMEVVQALRRDALDGVQAIQSDVHHPDEINSLFDPSIVYAKGGRLLRMLQTYIGDELLQKGLKRYFETYAYQNTEANDLWRCLSDVSGQDIGLIMNTWIAQSGYPVVHVSKQDDLITLEQEQFFIGAHNGSDKLWPIPLGALDDAFPRLLSEKTLTVTPTPGASLVFNHDSTAHYITHYSPELLSAVLEELPDLGDIDRLKILNEYTLLAQAELISSAELIELLSHYVGETTEAVWGIMSLALNELKKFVETDKAAEDKLRQLSGTLARREYERLGWEAKANESDSDTKLRSIIIGHMLYSEDSDVLATAQQLYDTTPVAEMDPNLRIGIMAAAVRAHSPETVIDDLLTLHNETTSSELREDIVAALTSTKNPEEVKRLLALIKDTSVVRSQDVLRWFIWLLRNRYGRRDSWQWIRQEWPWLEETFGSDKSYDIYPRYIASSLLTKEELKEYIEFFTPLSDQAALKRNIEVGITELSHRVKLVEQDGPAVRQALLDLN